MTNEASDRRFICDWMQCGKSFSHPDSLRIHYRRHTEEKPHHCHHCEAAYRQKSGLKYHLEKVHGEKTVGRCGRKRKLAVDSSSSQLPSSGLLLTRPLPSKIGEQRSEVEHGSGQMVLLDRSIKHTALSEVREMNVSMSDLQTKQWSKSNADESIAKGRRWSLPESLSQNCDDNLENIEINDEWLLDENDGFIDSHRKLPPLGASIDRNAADEGIEFDRDLAGSTSDTEPLDEDICEELRKLSDAINSEVLSPRGLDGMSSPFGSPVRTAYGAAKSESIGNVLPEVPASHSELYQGIGSSEEQSEVFNNNFSSPPPERDSRVTNDFYPRCPEVSITGTVLTHGCCNSSATCEHIEMVNGHLPDGYSCPANFDRNTPLPQLTQLPVDMPEMVAPASYHSAPFDGSVHQWPVPVNSSAWSSHSANNSPFLPAHGISSACSSAETGFGKAMVRQDGMYSDLMWSSLAESGQHWPGGHDGMIPSWSQRQLAALRGQTDMSRHRDWHMGRQGESAFSRSGTAFDDRVAFEITRQTSPKHRGPPYQAEMTEVPPALDQFVDSFTGKHAAIYPDSGIGHTGPWSDLYSRSSHMAGIGNYEHNLSRNVYRSPLQSDHFYLTSGYSGTHSHASYERSIETDGMYGVSNSPYRIPPVNAPSWPMPGFSSGAESLRSMPDAQPSSMLYNVVPRYY